MGRDKDMQKKNLINSIAAMLIAFAPIIPFQGCGIWLIGEPKLPKSMLKK